MSNTARPTPLRTQQVQGIWPALHPGQQAVVDSDARFKVVACGRQWGKTSVAAMLCIQAALEHRQDVWWVGPTFDLGIRGWRMIERLAHQADDVMGNVHFDGRPLYRITFPSGGSITLRSADNPDSLRGDTLDGVVFDEAAKAKPEAWPIVRPALAVRQGWGLFISTPRGMNHFYDLFQDAAALPGWERWQFPSTNSPYMPPSELDTSKNEMSSLLFSQEYEAEFIAYGSGMFQAGWIQHYHQTFDGEEKVYMLGTEPVRASDCSVLHTVDLAFSTAEAADYSVISTWAVTPKKHLLLVDMIRGRFEGPDFVPQLRTAHAKHGGMIYVEKVTRGYGIIQEAERAGLPIQSVRPEKDKRTRALPATARMERHQVWFPPASMPWYPEIEQELLAFPAGKHDDFVDTLAYACLAIAKGSAYGDHDLLII